MDVTKGLTGRRVCGGIEVTFGALLGMGAIYNVANGYINIFSFVIAGFLMVTGILGIAGNTINMIMAYMVTGIICTLYFGYAHISSIVAIITYNSLLTEIESDVDPDLAPILVVAVLVTALGFIVSAIGVIFAALPFRRRSEEQNEALLSK